ncbi:MAG: hypothetical protein WC248_01415 [Candidatus Methanomethylophilaceae archaeon]|jgi:hypothetical protein
MSKSEADSDFEKFVLENSEKIIAVLKAQKNDAEVLFSDEKAKVEDLAKMNKEKIEEYADAKKAKVEEVAIGVFGAVANPVVQRHFIKMGMEFMMGMDEMLKAMPMPEAMKKTWESATDARDIFTDSYCDVNPKCQTKKKGTKKIELE